MTGRSGVRRSDPRCLPEQGRPPSGGCWSSRSGGYLLRVFVQKSTSHSVGLRAVDIRGTTARSLGPSYFPPLYIALLDDLIRPPQQRRRNRQAERPSRLEVDDQAIRPPESTTTL